jgi:hypothetical protein
MAKKKNSITVDCDFKETYQKLQECTETISTYDIALLKDDDKHDLRLLVKMAEQLIDIYRDQADTAELEEYEDINIDEE